MNCNAMTSLTFINPDGKLMIHKKYVNWEGVREVEGLQYINNRIAPDHIIKLALMDVNKGREVPTEFTIQD